VALGGFLANDPGRLIGNSATHETGSFNSNGMRIGLQCIAHCYQGLSWIVALATINPTKAAHPGGAFSCAGRMLAMNNPNPDSTGGSKTGIVVAVVLLVLALPCCAGLFLIGGTVWLYRASEVQGPVQPPPSPERSEPDANQCHFPSRLPLRRAGKLRGRWYEPGERQGA
jgi:hypothetical protein